MKFNEFETIMKNQGVYSLAEIARKYSTTPQAVSNWKARNQVPYHVISSLNNLNANPPNVAMVRTGERVSSSFTFSDIIVNLTEQLKVIVLMTFIFAFASLNYNQFMKKPLYRSSATLLIKEDENNNRFGGLAGLASQFGVSVSSSTSPDDLSSPTLFPELIRSRAFSEQMLQKRFQKGLDKKEYTLFQILTNQDSIESLNDLEMRYAAIGEFQKMVSFTKKLTEKFSTLDVIADDPVFARDLANAVLSQLETMNKFYKSKSLNEKIYFINNRINSVNKELTKSEKELKQFNESNIQISSPALTLENERLEREVEIQKDIFITLKQQLELAKIQEVEGGSSVQVLDHPEIPYEVTNKNLINSLIFSSMIGFAIGVIIAMLRAYFKNSNIEERKKFRKIKVFFRKKSASLFSDYLFTGIVMLCLIAGAPNFLTHKSKNPIFFELYSLTALLVNLFYIFILFSSSFLTFKNYQNSKKKFNN